ncbi:e3 ubiquitin-protein ligase RNF13 [Trichonephila clavipes]|nr:e3 ubiquitin-protein ligase RNF13 [Trichonephila clavipes]
MPNSPSQMIPDMLDWRQFWGLRRPMKDSKSAETVLWHPCRAMAPHTIPPAVGAVCRCKEKAGLKRSPWGLYTRTQLSSLLRLNLDSSLKMNWFHSAAV